MLKSVLVKLSRRKKRIRDCESSRAVCHDPKTGLLQRSDLGDVNWEVSDKIMFLPRIRMCEEGKIFKHIKNISRKLTWRYDSEPVAIGLCVALNLSA